MSNEENCGDAMRNLLQDSTRQQLRDDLETDATNGINGAVRRGIIDNVAIANSSPK